MRKPVTIQACLARANELTDLADHASDYDMILLYDGLAREWRRIAGLIEAPRRPTQEMRDDR